MDTLWNFHKFWAIFYKIMSGKHENHYDFFKTNENHSIFKQNGSVCMFIISLKVFLGFLFTSFGVNRQQKDSFF